MKDKNLTLPGFAFDGLFTAHNLATIDTAVSMAEQTYRLKEGEENADDYDPDIRDAIVDTCLKLQVLKERLIGAPNEG